jgi:GNAT superfamily N-acetyltransferase
MALEVRAARHEDIPLIAPWTTHTFDWGDYVPQRLPGWIDDPDSLALVCVDETGEVIGVSNTRMLSPGEAWLEGARVHPDHKREGVGSAMNTTGLAWAADRGARVARLATESDNLAARSQVESLGYRHTSSWAHATLTPSAGSPVAPESEMRTAPTADVDSAWLSWVPGDLARSGRELLAEGWRWRRARPEDLALAANRGELVQSPSGWAIVEQPEDDWMRTGWVSTTPEEGPALLDGLLGLARSRQVNEVDVKIPWLPWVTETLTRAGGQPRQVLIYSMRL